MIVKVMNASGWTLYGEVKKVSHGIIDGTMPIGVSETCDDFTNFANPQMQRPTSPAKENPVVDLWLTLNDDTVKQVLAYSPVFLLNNEGKTIDRF